MIYRNKNLLRVTAYLVFLVSVLNSLAVEAKTYTPKIIPEGWVDDFDYKGSMVAYLKNQYQLARESDSQLFVYIYSDRVQNCRAVRKAMKLDMVREAYANTRIVMFEYRKFMKHVYAKDVKERDATYWQPTIHRVSEAGLLTRDVFYPDLQLNRQRLLRFKANRPAVGDIKGNGYIQKYPYSRAAKKFFESFK